MTSGPNPTANEVNDPAYIALENYIKEIMESYQGIGLAVVVVQGDEIVYKNGFGVRVKGGNDPVTPGTLMMIGSASKTFTSMMIATLVDEGIVKWDTRVVDILPTFALSDPQITQQVTLQHLVCNCTGVPMRNIELLFNYHSLTAEAVIEELAEFPLIPGFGNVFGYSNQMVAVGGYIAALSAGEEYGKLYDGYVKLMQERVLTPIGMTSTTFSFDRVRESGNYALPHIPTLAFDYIPVPLNAEEWAIPITPAGGLWSNAEDMARYLITQLNQGIAPDGSRVVSAENLAFTQQPQVKVTTEMSYGLGWSIESYNGYKIINHPGGTTGFSTDMVLIPELDTGIVVLANQLYLPLHTELFPAIRMRLLELLLGGEPIYDRFLKTKLQSNKRQWSSLFDLTSDSVERDVIVPYLGTYANENLGEVTLTLGRDGQFIFDAGEFWNVLRPLKTQNNAFVFDRANFIGQKMSFTRDDDGIITFTLPDPITGKEGEYVFKKLPQDGE